MSVSNSLCFPEDSDQELSNLESPGNLSNDDEVSIAIFLKVERNQDISSSYRSASVLIHSSSRYYSVSWILKVQAFYGFQAVTAYLAVNYLDRFLSSHRLPQTGGWPLQLLTVACLSLAAKMEEPLVPSLFDLQVEDATNFMFEAKTIQRMELLVLSVLDWRLRLVTPFTFISFFAYKLDASGSVAGHVLSRSTDIILAHIQEASSLEYRPSSVAAAAILCAASEFPSLSFLTPEHSHSWCDGLSKENVKDCYNLMQQSMADHSRRKAIKVIPRLRVSAQMNGAMSYIDSPVSTPSPLSSLSTSTPSNKRRKLNSVTLSWVDDDY